MYCSFIDDGVLGNSSRHMGAAYSGSECSASALGITLTACKWTSILGSFLRVGVGFSRWGNDSGVFALDVAVTLTLFAPMTSPSGRHLCRSVGGLPAP